jgi:hypothetical protein
MSDEAPAPMTDQKLIVIISVILSTMMLACLLLSAANIFWFDGWALVGIVFADCMATLFWIVETRPHLLKSIVASFKNAKTLIVGLFWFIGICLWFVLMGLDVRTNALTNSEGVEALGGLMITGATMGLIVLSVPVIAAGRGGQGGALNKVQLYPTFFRRTVYRAGLIYLFFLGAAVLLGSPKGTVISFATIPVLVLWVLQCKVKILGDGKKS